ncbi:MAG: hypothetical protein CMP86_15440 [Gammaproteobacteria bacterium]|nr:hypothetical protein [Gammaproteobacteria bacterium]
MKSVRPLRSNDAGMTVLELLLAITMLLVFTGVVVMVSGTIIRFLSPINSGSGNGVVRSNGLLIDQKELRSTMQTLASVLEQPGMSREKLLDPDARIAFAQSTDPEQACVINPVRSWSVPISAGNIPSLPAGYRICLWTTSIKESSLQQLMNKDDGAQPGVYVLQALPEELTTSHLPIRLLFCRPKPFC